MMGLQGVAQVDPPMPAQMAAEDAVRKAAEHGMPPPYPRGRVSGPGSGRESARRALQAAGFTVTSIRDVTPIPHNGCRPARASPASDARSRAGAFGGSFRFRGGVRACRPSPVSREGVVVIQKNWQELIKPNKLEVSPGFDPRRVATVVAETAGTRFRQ